MPKISVIVPVYKVEQYLNRCVDSILNQSFKDFELILVDDGSPDNCGKICDEYAGKNERVHVIHQQNGGLSAARNAGIDWAFANSDSEWITFIDSDDWVSSEYLSIMYNAVINQDTDICISQIIDYDKIPIIDGNIKPEKIEVIKFYKRHVQGINLVSSCAKLYKKEQWRDIRFPVGKINEDRFTTHKLIFQNKEASIIFEPLYYYYINENSIMHSEWTPKKMDDLEAIKEQFEFFKERNLRDAWNKIAFDHIVILITFNDLLKKIYPKYKNYKRKIILMMKFYVIKYHLLRVISIKKDKWIFNSTFPNLIKIYNFFELLMYYMRLFINKCHLNK